MATVASRPQPFVRPDGSPVRALVVDDETSLGDLLRMALRAEGWTTQLADNGSDALRIAREFEPDDERRVDLVPASLVKGLEFDHVVLLEPARLVDGEADEVTGLRRLYVCLTRAVTTLVVVHADDLPLALAA